MLGQNSVAQLLLARSSFRINVASHLIIICVKILEHNQRTILFDSKLDRRLDFVNSRLSLILHLLLKVKVRCFTEF